MGQIAYYVAISLDGYIADADGGVGWLPEDDGEDYGYADFYDGVGALVMGRRTYDQVLGFGQWPYAGKSTYVFTSHPPDDNPFGVEFFAGSAAEFVQSVAPNHSGAVWLVGGANLAEQFRREGLIDRFLVFVIPVALGKGIPLFDGDGGVDATQLRLESVQSYNNGVVGLEYSPAGG